MLSVLMCHGCDVEIVFIDSDGMWVLEFMIDILAMERRYLS